MATHQYNEFLDAGHSDDDDLPQYDSEDAHKAKGKITTSRKSTKRRKVNRDSSDEESDEDIASVVHLHSSTASKTTQLPLESISAAKSTPTSNAPNFPPTKPPISKTPINPTKTGVIYLSRIPPFMRPSTVRHLLSPFGPIIKLFLTPEPPAQHTSRVRSGGNKKRSFIDGWIEFSSHKHAKTCVAAINGQTMGGRGWYRDDVWNAKYLRGFGWEDLMAGVRGEEREREERVRVGVRREKREREEFLKGAERGKMEETKKRKRKGKGEQGESVEGVVGEGKKETFERRFRQNEVKKRQADEQPEEVRRVLSKIF